MARFCSTAKGDLSDATGCIPDTPHVVDRIPIADGELTSFEELSSIRPIETPPPEPIRIMKCILVSHSHWDREWYRTFQDFRARLVDLIDRVIEICDADPGYHFLLDGQTIVLEDYLEIRPERAQRLRALCAEGRLAIGPWYVQPDSLIPSGEAHIRNLLLGRRVGEAIGPVSRVGYTPDSFGHPAQFPQLFSGFGIGSFVYWRGNGNEIDELPAEYDWEAPDGSRIVACHLGKGYFCAATTMRAELEGSVKLIGERAMHLAARTRSEVVLLLNGLDHAPPEARTKDLAEQLAQATGFEVRRGLLDDFVSDVLAAKADRPCHTGELIGGRVAPLLPGVWSTRTWIKLENRRAETALEGWAEPFAALAQRFGLDDESPALRLAWKELLKNQAHDSICGCSRDEVHEQMAPRFDTARELADQTTGRCLERIAGLGPDRNSPWSDEFDLLVANPSPRSRTDVVRFPLDFHPYVVPNPNPIESIHPTVMQDLAEMTFTADGVPARLVPAETGRMKLLPDRGVFDLEFVASDVPAMGFRRVRIRRASEDVAAADSVEEVRPGAAEASIETDGVRVSLLEDGRFDVRIHDREFHALGELESTGDRGDTYDYDEVLDGPGLKLESISAQRRVHPGGISELRVTRHLTLPARLASSREERSVQTAPLVVETLLRVAPGIHRVDIDLRVVNAAEDHRLRMLFPVSGRVDRFDAATTFDVTQRSPGPSGEEGWVQAPPATFPHQGFVHANGLSVVAPGLAEAELIPGDPSRIAITLLRCVGSLSRPDLRSRPGPAGPGTDTPGAQCAGTLLARLSLLAGLDPARARESELGLRAVAAGDEPLAPQGEPLVLLEPSSLVVSAFKPAESGDGVVLRVLNPTNVSQQACVTLGFAFQRVEPQRLDEEPEAFTVSREGSALRFSVPAHGLRTLGVF
jgi:mannosylglycerate hydrolase